MDHFTKALHCADHLPAAEVSERRLSLLNDLGALLTTTGQYDRALEHLTQSRTLALERDDADAQARACRWLARLHELRGDYPPALEWIQTGLAALNGRDSAEGAHMRLIAGLINVRQGNADLAIEQCQHALETAQALGEVTAEARAYNLLGVIQLRRNSAMAFEYFQHSLDLYQRAGDLPGQATAHNLIANAHFGLGRWPEADGEYRRARDLFHQLGDVYNRSFADNNLGGIALNQGRLDQALEFYEQAVRSFTQIGGSLYVLGVLHSNLGGTLIRRGEIERAREHLRESQQYFERSQARDSLPELHRRFAEAALLSNELAEAQAHCQQALTLARELSARGEEGMILRVLGQVAAANGQPAEAEAHLNTSIAILDEVSDDYEGARSRLALAELYATTGRAAEATARLAQCEPVFQRLETALDLNTVRAVRGWLAQLNGFESVSTDTQPING